MHQSVMNFISSVVNEYDLSDKYVIEAGSYNVNGSAKSAFTGKYWGIDMRDGPDVNEVMMASKIGNKYYEQFDVAVCAEMLEHDIEPWASLLSLYNSVKRGGKLIVTARGFDESGFFPLHDYPQDLWRYTVDGMKSLLEFTSWKVIRIERDPEQPGVLAFAEKE